MLKLRFKSKKSIFKRMQTNNRLRLHSMALTQTNNNLFVNLGDARGNTLHMVTTASRGFRGKKEIKSFLANVSTGEEMARRVTAIGVRRLNIRLKGFSKMKYCKKTY
jgi:ribosomal protein S11